MQHGTQPKHEQTDISARGILWFGVGLIVAAILIHLGLWYFDRELTSRYPSPQAATRIVQPHSFPPPPQLQTDPAEDLKSMRAEEDQVLNSYGWVDHKAGTIRIPIQRAIELTLQRGLPARAVQTGGTSQ